MATLILGSLVTSAGGSTLAVALAVTAGSVIDRQLFGPDPPEFGKLDDLRVPAFDEGVPAPVVIGKGCRVQGTPIYLSELIEVKDEGGKGGLKKGPVTYEYFVDVAYAFNRGQVEGIPRLWIQGDLIYDRDADVAISSSSISATAFTEQSLYYGPFGSAQEPQLVDKYHYLRLNSPDGGPDLSQVRSGYDVDVDGFSNSVNNQPNFRCVSSALLPNGTSFCTLRFPSLFGNVPNVGPGVNEAAGNTITIDQDIPEFSSSKLGSLTVYLGTPTQTADATLEARIGAGNVPGFRGTAYVVIGRLNVSNYGGSLPGVEGLVEQDTALTVQEAVTAICLSSGRLTVDDIDVTGLSTDTVEGFVTSGPTAPLERLKMMAFVHNFDVQEREGKLVFFQRDSPDTVTVIEGDQGAHDAGATPEPRTILSRRVSDSKLTQAFDIKFQDATNDYQPGMRGYRYNQNVTNNGRSADVSGSLTPQQAMNLAIQKCYTLRTAAKYGYRFRLPPSYMRLVEGDNAVLTIDDEDVRVRITKVEEGANFLREYEATREHLPQYAFTQSFAELPTIKGDAKLALPPDVSFGVFDLPALVEDNAEKVGLFVYMATPDAQSPFGGATLFESEDSNVFAAKTTFNIGATAGRATTTLGGGVTGLYLDRDNTVTVELFDSNNELTSTGFQQVAAGANRMLIGSEIIGFLDATLVSTGVYTLSNLIRGMFNTEEFIDEHGTSESFVILGSLGQTFIETGLTSVGTQRVYKAVPTGQAVADVPGEVALIQGNSYKNYTPYAVRATRNSSGDIDIRWLRRTRVPFRTFSPTVAPLLDTEGYQLEILNGSTVVRTVTGLTSPTYTYSATDQTSDFGSTQSSLDIIVYQTGDVIPLGRGKEATV